MKFNIIFFILLILLFLRAVILSAEEIELANGVFVQAKILNESETPRKNWRIQLTEGVTLELSNDKVMRHVAKDSKIREQYYTKVPFMTESVETHLKMAEICQSQNLNDLANRHYLRILELDANQSKAREQLGYRKVGENWITREDEMLRQGYVQTKQGGWTTRQNLLIQEKQIPIGTSFEDAELTTQIQNLIERLRTNDAAAENKLLEMNNPAVVRCLADILKDEQNLFLREKIIRTLGKMKTAYALREIAAWSLQEANNKICVLCLFYIKEKPSFSRFYYPYLRSTNNEMVNRAAFALGELGDRAAIPLLIDSLITRHLVKIIIDDRTPGARVNTNQLITEEREETVSNRECLNALQRLTAVNFEYDIPAWRLWWEEQQLVRNFNARRGSID
ncbi:MAG: hypothetical protein LBJ67_07105 [Planctomycetaceae bacterium]|jgi:hypothetical protein|nr:hypothetical protein [Planctomycetaceae bacterium]